MAKQVSSTNIVHVPKRTTIGNGKIRMSSLNKNKRRSYKPYNRQGK
jgi:hypothetical protein